MRAGLLVGALVLAAAPLAASAQALPAHGRATAPAINPDRNLEAARSYSPSPALESLARDATVSARPAAPVGRVNGSASRDWTLHALG